MEFRLLIPNEEEKIIINIDSDDENENRRNVVKPARKQKQKVYNRHTPEQYQKLQEFYELNAYPDERERETIGAILGLDQLRVKFWFQNRRSLNKIKSEKKLNKQLKEENDLLHAENESLRLSLMSASCLCCKEHSLDNSVCRIKRLKVANVNLKRKNDKLESIITQLHGIENKSSHFKVDNSVEMSITEGSSSFGCPCSKPRFEETITDVELRL